MRKHCGPWFAAMLLATACLSGFPSSLHAFPESETNSLQQQAARLEEQHQWDKACDVYERLLSKNRTSATIRERYLACLRQAQLIRRLHDPSLRTQVLTRDLSLTLKLYGEVLLKLHANYVDRAKADWTHLFRYGIDEFLAAVADDSFRSRYGVTADAGALQKFRDHLTQTWSSMAIGGIQDAQAQVTEIALAAQQSLGLKPVVTVLEFACGACCGLDEYTVFLTPGQLNEETTSLDGETMGVGIEVAALDHKLVVGRVDGSSPAALAGLKPGDVLVSLDGRPLASVSAEMATEWLKGSKGSRVTLEVISQGESKARKFALVRQPILVPSILQAQMLNLQQGIGYIQLACFQTTTVQELDEAILQLKMQGLRGLILDLRGNPGGLFQPAVQTAERFLTSGIIVTTQGQVRDQNHTYRADNPNAWQMPLMVLIDGDTASAAEIVAGALKDHQRATLIGQPSYGKGSIQGVLELEAVPSGIRLTLARFFSPRGNAYSGQGVTPHLPVERQPISLADHVLEIAVQQLIRLLALGQ